MSDLQRRGRDAMALLFVLGTVAVLSATAAGLHGTSMADWRVGRREADRVGARAAALSGVELGRQLLALDDRTYFWFPEAGDLPPGPGGAPRALSPLEDAYRRLAATPTDPLELDGARLVIRIEDESGRIPLNRSPGAHVANLAEVLRAVTVSGSEEEPEAGMRRAGLADSLADWRDSDGVARQAGAENPYYEGLEPLGYLPRNAALEDMGELAWVRGFTQLLLAGEPGTGGGSSRPGLASGLTVFGLVAAVNANQASAEVLAATPGLFESPGRGDLVGALLAGRPFVDRVDLKAVLDAIDPTASALAIPWLCVRSEYFRIVVRAVGNGGAAVGIECVVRKPPGGALQTVGWTES